MEFWKEEGFGWSNELENCWETPDDIWIQTQLFNE